MDQLQADARVRAGGRARLASLRWRASLASTQSQISRQVAALEQRLGASLLTRTTRQVQLTPDGQLYLDFARRALLETDEGEALLRGGRQTLSGRLRLSTSAAIFKFLVFEPLQGLMAQHTSLELDIQINDAWVDLVTEGIDLAVRAGQLHDSNLIARELAELPMVVVAAPQYLQREADRRPPIVVPAALEQHECLLFTLGRDPRWQFEDEAGRRQQVSVAGALALQPGPCGARGAAARPGRGAHAPLRGG